MGFKENLKNIRKEKKLSQKAFGELIGKKEITIRNYESGKIMPPLKVIENISNKLNVPIYELIDFSDNLPENVKLKISEEIENKMEKELNLIAKYGYSDIDMWLIDFNNLIRESIEENKISIEKSFELLLHLKKYYEFLINDYKKTQK